MTAGQVRDLVGADGLLPGIEADAVLADKVYDADEWAIKPLLSTGKEPVVPPKSNRKEPRPFDKDLYKARSSTETFCANSNKSAPSPPVATRLRATSWP